MSPSVADAAMGRIAQGTSILAEGGYEKILCQTLRQCQRGKCRIHLLVTCRPQLVQSWESYMYLGQNLHSAATVLCHIHLVAKRSGVIIRFVGISLFFQL